MQLREFPGVRYCLLREETLERFKAFRVAVFDKDLFPSFLVWRTIINVRVFALLTVYVCISKVNISFMNMTLAYYDAFAHFIVIGYLHAIVILSMRICTCTKKKSTRFDSIVLYRVLRGVSH